MPLLGALGPSLDGLGGLLGGFGPSWEGLGGVLGRSWGLLGPFWTVLGGFYEPLGGVLAHLEGVLGPLGRLLGGSWAGIQKSVGWIQKSSGWIQKSFPLGTVLAAILGSINQKPRNGTAPSRWWSGSWVDFGSQNGSPRRPQNESKIKTKNASLFCRSWTRLGLVLRRSWDPSWGQKTAQEC